MKFRAHPHSAGSPDWCCMFRSLPGICAYLHIPGVRASSQQDGLFDGVKTDIAIVRTRHMKLLGRCLVRTENQQI